MPLDVTQCDGLADKTNPRGDLRLAPALTGSIGIRRGLGKRAIYLPAIVQRENAVIALDHALATVMNTPEAASQLLDAVLERQLLMLSQQPQKELLDARYEKFRKMGQFFDFGS